MAMRAFTAARGPATPCELWLLEHPPVFTLGQAGRLAHLHQAGDIPVVQSDRGGQITYHGPGQLVAYTLFDLHRLGSGIRRLVEALEQSVIDALKAEAVNAERREKAPGVYVDGAKIASVGLRVKRGCTFHGLSFNVDMDLAPFGQIDPCGYPGLAVTQCRDLGLELGVGEAGDRITEALCALLGYHAEAAEDGIPVKARDRTMALNPGTAPD